jgi:phosphoribosylformylglycinamidine synthase
MKAVVTVMPKPAILDPAGVAAGRAMEHLGLKGVRSVRIGKSIEIEIEGVDSKHLEEKLHEISHDLLSNPVVEDYKLEILS